MTLQNMLSAIFKKYGEPDTLINCSYPVTKDWHKSTFQKIKYPSFKKNIEIHLNSYCWIAKIFADRMVLKNKPGNIVLLSSIYGIVAQNLKVYEGTKIKENFVYSSIKAAIISFAKQSCSYYAKYEIRVNAISPGGVIDKLNKKNKTFLKNYIRQNPTKRLANSDEVAASALFLLSEEASYVNGVNFIVDGGWTSV